MNGDVSNYDVSIVSPNGFATYVSGPSARGLRATTNISPIATSVVRPLLVPVDFAPAALAFNGAVD
jgi:hypothetical protein